MKTKKRNGTDAPDCVNGPCETPNSQACEECESKMFPSGPKTEFTGSKDDKCKEVCKSIMNGHQPGCPYYKEKY